MQQLAPPKEWHWFRKKNKFEKKAVTKLYDRKQAGRVQHPVTRPPLPQAPKLSPPQFPSFPTLCIKLHSTEKKLLQNWMPQKRIVGWLSVEIAVSVNHTAGNSLQLEFAVDSVTLRSNRLVCARDINTSFTDPQVRDCENLSPVW